MFKKVYDNFALTYTGDLYGWGQNSFGQLDTEKYINDLKILDSGKFHLSKQPIFSKVYENTKDIVSFNCNMRNFFFVLNNNGTVFQIGTQHINKAREQFISKRLISCPQTNMKLTKIRAISGRYALSDCGKIIHYFDLENNVYRLTKPLEKEVKEISAYRTMGCFVLTTTDELYYHSCTKKEWVLIAENVHTISKGNKSEFVYMDFEGDLFVTRIYDGGQSVGKKFDEFTFRKKDFKCAYIKELSVQFDNIYFTLEDQLGVYCVKIEGSEIRELENIQSINHVRGMKKNGYSYTIIVDGNVAEYIGEEKIINISWSNAIPQFSAMSNRSIGMGI